MQPNAPEEPPVPKTDTPAELSDREREILKLVATGASNKQIAQQLVISPNTVKVHLRNVFAKIGVASRTEAALYAIRAGLVQVSANVALPVDEPDDPAPSPLEAPPSTSPATALPVAPEPLPLAPPTLAAAPTAPRRTARSLLWIGAGGLVLVALALAGYALLPRPAPLATPAPPTATAAIARWQALANMPLALSSLAAVSYETKIYAVGGATASGVSGQTESYDLTSHAWTALAAKPVPVADVSAAVIGGLIYVPGGRTASGQMTNVLEVYNPRTDSWAQRAPLPKALSAYALAAFEGQLYLFGGWDGQHELDTVYSYNSDLDRWSMSSAMPQARAFAGAAAAAGTIYVVGGENETGPLAMNEQYTPAGNSTSPSPWSPRAPLPSAESGLAVSSIADIVYVVGGEARPGQLGVWEYFPQSDKWQALDAPGLAPTARLAVAPVDTRLFVLGGLQAKTPTNQFLVYQAIYSTIFPLIGGSP